MSDATREYKDVIGELTAAAEALRARDRDRAEALRSLLVELDTAMVRAVDRAARSRRAVELHSEAVLDALADEKWMSFEPRPRPDLDADPEQLDALDMAVDRAATEVLAEARHRFPFGLG